MQKAFDVIAKLQGKTLVTAESITGGGIGAALTAVSGASSVYKGGVISYCDEVKRDVLGVPDEILRRYGAVAHTEPIAHNEYVAVFLADPFECFADDLARAAGFVVGGEVASVIKN